MGTKIMTCYEYMRKKTMVGVDSEKKSVLLGGKQFFSSDSPPSFYHCRAESIPSFPTSLKKPFLSTLTQSLKMEKKDVR
jgi:hypothetical protein